SPPHKRTFVAAERFDDAVVFVSRFFNGTSSVSSGTTNSTVTSLLPDIPDPQPPSQLPFSPMPITTATTTTNTINITDPTPSHIHLSGDQPRPRLYVLSPHGLLIGMLWIAYIPGVIYLVLTQTAWLIYFMIANLTFAGIQLTKGGVDLLAAEWAGFPFCRANTDDHAPTCSDESNSIA
ncbi:unnamed protein product, partial [Protopolystoma xenopodis]